MTRFWIVAAASGAGLVAAPAASQIINDVISATVSGMSSHGVPGDPKCLSGERLASPEAEAEARAGAEAAMKTYFALAGAARGADASAAFIPRSRLRGSERTSDKRPVDRVDDPLARALVAGEAEVEPLQFFRAGQVETAIGRWTVRDAGGTRLGQYWVRFRPEAGLWKITWLGFLVEPAQATQTMSRYCLMTGDVDRYQAEVERRAAKRARKEAARTGPARDR